MKYFSSLALSLTIILIIAGCGIPAPQATPTLDADIQGTIVAAAMTVIAETQAAIPTAIPLPTATLTNTPAPTDTLLPLPSLEAAFTPNPNGNPAGNDPCIYQTLPPSLPGEQIKVRIDNGTKATVSVSVKSTAKRTTGFMRLSRLHPGAGRVSCPYGPGGRLLYHLGLEPRPEKLFYRDQWKHLPQWFRTRGIYDHHQRDHPWIVEPRKTN